jgi:hypothetical protein
MTDSQNRRQFWRAVFQSPVRLVTDAGAVEARLEDISLKGALFEMPVGWRGRIGEPCHIKLHLAEGVIIAMWGKVAHLEGRFTGMRCETIDLESITHLRRLVELNSGDPSMLERELHSLATI